MKKNIYKPKSIQEAVNDLEVFLECDLYTKFRPEEKLPTGKNGKMESWSRLDSFENEKQFVDYIRAHFEILEKELKERLGRKYGQETKRKTKSIKR